MGCIITKNIIFYYYTNIHLRKAERENFMRILCLASLGIKSPSFSQIVDYGARDKSLVYIPLIQEEEDDFNGKKSSDYQNNTDKPASKFSKLAKKGAQVGGSVFAGATVVDTLVGSVKDSTTGVMNNVKDIANSTIDTVADIKSNYANKFGKPHEPAEDYQHDDFYRKLQDDDVSGTNEQQIAKSKHDDDENAVTENIDEGIAQTLIDENDVDITDDSDY